MRKTYKVVTVKFEEAEHAELKASKGSRTLSAHIKDLIARGKRGDRVELDQFIELLKKMESVTNVAAGIERVEQKLGEGTSGDNEKILEMLTKMVDGIRKMVEAGKGVTAIKSGGAGKEVIEKLNTVRQHVGYVVQAVEGIKATAETIREAVKAKVPAPVPDREWKPLEGETAKEALEIIYRELQDLQRAIAHVTSDTNVIKNAIIEKQKR